jgi:hypothetical protein
VAVAVPAGCKVGAATTALLGFRNTTGAVLTGAKLFLDGLG